jgi:8-amino-7-oxononanoate synthase
MFRKELCKLKKNNLLRQVIERGSPQGPVITIGGKRYLNFSSNDYLGLAGHPELLKAAAEAGKRFGFGSGASRLLGGGSSLHEKLEKKTAAFKETEAALIFNSGYAGNTGIIPSLASPSSVIFSDELNHASIIDGCRLSGAKVLVFKHRQTGHLEELLKRGKARSRVVVTDSVFSMDGDIAPLQDLYRLCLRYGAVLYIDDAHGTGVLGEGRGALSHFGLLPEPWILQMGTFSKALGSFGAFAAGDGDVIRWLTNTARSFMFSTALPAPVVAASMKAIGLIDNRRGLVRTLWRNRKRLADGLIDIGYGCRLSETPIITIRPGNLRETIALSAFLWGKGIYAPAIRPPTVIEPRVRITVTAAHTEGHVLELIDTLKRF